MQHQIHLLKKKKRYNKDNKPNFNLKCGTLVTPEQDDFINTLIYQMKIN